MNADELAKLLDELGRRLGPGGEYVFRLAVERVVVQSVVALAVSCLLFALALVGAVLIRRAIGLVHADGESVFRDDYHSKSAENQFWTGALLLAVTSTVGVIVAVPTLTNLLTPEYTALRDILSAIRP